MAAISIRTSVFGTMLAASAVFFHPAAGVRAQAPVSGDSTSLLEVAATQARVAAGRIESAGQNAGRAGRADPAAAQYQTALDFINKKQYDSALTPLRAVVAVSRNSAKYHGDLGLALAETGNLEQGGTEYQTAIRLQGANPWYYVGLGVIRLNQERWTEAAANFELAYGADSTILSPTLVEAASQAAERSSDENSLLQWSQRATARLPDDAMPWLRVATLLRSRGDTARGIEAIRRFRTLSPQDRRGAAIYAMYLYPRGQFDSAVAMARQALPDSTLRQYASHVFLQAGAHWLNAKQYDSAATVLEEALPITPSGLTRIRVVYWLGLADLMRVPTLYSAAVQQKDCSQVPLLDSLLATAQNNVTQAAQAGDSAETSRILTNYVPTLRQRVAEFKNSCQH